MSEQVDRLLQAALALPAEDQLRLLDALAASVEERGLRKFDDSWLAEIERRSAEFDAGAVRLIPSADVTKHARRALLSPEGWFHIRSDERHVEAWSVDRIVFDPKGWLRQFREQLGEAVRRLRAGNAQILYGVYASELRETCDLENILLYNVGPGRFTSAARHGLRLERSFHAVPSCPEPLSDLPRHYHHYSLDDASGDFRSWKMQERLVEWSFECPDGRKLRSCSAVWQSMKSGRLLPLQYAADATALGLRVELGVPADESIRPAELIKPLADGIIAALHFHDGTDAEEVGRRLATQLGARADEILADLSDPTAAVLGGRRLLWKWGDKLQWNPQDDALVALELLSYTSPAVGPWQVKGELFTAKLREGVHFSEA